MVRIANETIALVLIAASATMTANAQTRPAPGGALPGGLTGTPTVGTPVTGNPLLALPQVTEPRTSPNVTVQVEKQTSQLQQLLATHLTPSKIQIDGVKAIPFSDVAQRFAALVGKDITVGQLIETANDVTKLYQQRGYALSFAFVPAQTFENGVVRVTVVEGYVASINVTGKPGRAERKIREIAEHIRNERPLRRATFERYINTLGLLPGITVAATVPPPKTTDGATTLDLNVDRKPFNVGTGIDFHHPGVQGLVTATETSLTSLGEQLSVSALVPKGRDNQTYYAASGALPIGSNGLVARVDASHYHGNPVDNPGLPSYVQRTVVNDKLGVSAAYPLFLSNAHKVIGTVSGYASHDENSYLNTLNGAEIGLRSQVRVVQAQIDYTEVETNQVRRASVNVAKAFDILGASKSGDTNVPGAIETNPVSLTFVRTGVSFSQTNQWPLKIGTAVSFTSQYSPDSLPTSEQIAFGAQRFAQGYQPGEASGDSGWGASFEVNRPIAIGMRYFQTFTPYVSFDMARVYLHSGAPSPSKLSSVSLGLRLSDSKHYSLDLSIAKAVADAPIESPSRSPRVNATFSYQLF
ncbi:hemolysin activation/secretion protein [Trinickia symbiotica]|uniref:ShlB/FhaC/HecB family hemolysin secretion/activation protein n=1 Tax=Trinickia symbiotica TaxID=863227 RepID=A0A2N7X951_9BURK|nr:POTRA domain-containing protein [Trinickia symbiotica]PMS38082.1 ShlB/FhaC/HecB family hemolysin secretion/activation protein [Trinickia symbiotica]PPK47252.1 hemolysin activation/secretion protein [Trinickia symbiotica]